jgi:energy-coupling factor transporter ATP-binding protein EcfA2
LRFFVSLSGVISTSNSADNILKLNSNNSFESLNIEYSHDNILINSYKSNKTGIKYKKFNYYKGINIVSGASGSGKTTYFLDILKKLFSSNIQCHYITYDFFKEQMNTIGSFENTILFLLKDITVQKIPNVVIYDEITNVVSSCNLNEALEFLNLLAIQTGTVVMLSDHRIFEGTSKYKLHRLSNDKD